ncbi:methionine-synthesizing 5- methyltetrahydropteroyltriglutamate--homocysteine methyltransferase [Tulasnella sp. 427]|nr:methionine-synthesizing 5- methyltetrahydropteroyltriglutamate--homocysteine methyltransferase [Tulasnella sp. 427]
MKKKDRPQQLHFKALLGKKLIETVTVPLPDGQSASFQVQGTAVTQRIVRLLGPMVLPRLPKISDAATANRVWFGSGEDFKELEFQGDLWLNYYLGSMVFRILRRMYGQRRWSRTVSGHVSGCVRSNAVFSMLGFRLGLALSPTSKSTADRFEAMVHAIRQDPTVEVEPWIEKIFTPLIEEACLVVAQKLPGPPQRIDLPSTSQAESQTTYHEDDDGYIIIDDSSDDETEIVEVSRTEEEEVMSMLAVEANSTPAHKSPLELYNCKAKVTYVEPNIVSVNVPKMGERAMFEVDLTKCTETVESYKHDMKQNQLDIVWKPNAGEEEEDDEIQMDCVTSAITVGCFIRAELIAEGPKREIKFAVESYWGNKSSAEDLQKVAAEIRKQSWTNVKSKGVDHVPRQVTQSLPPTGEFSLYDHVLDHSAAFNVIPSRYQNLGLSPLDVFFAMGRGRQADGVDVPASEMKKWFDSNYHFVVPEFSDATDFKLNYNKALNEYKEAKEAGINTRPVVLGPLSFLVLGKPSRSAQAGFQPISLLSKVLPLYEKLLGELKEAGAEWVQVDEPILVLDAASNFSTEFTEAYTKLSAVAPKILLTTYFGRLESNLDYVAKLPIAGLHIDLDREPGQLEAVANAIKDTKIVLSLGLVSGRNIWKNDFQRSIELGRKAIDILGEDRVIVATSSSLLHTPVTLASETKLTEEQKDWFSFALEKAGEVATIAAVLSGSQDAEVAKALEANIQSIKKRREFEQNSDDTVRKRVAAITPDDLNRKSPFPARAAAQKALGLPKFPTTTIGSFPQTKEIRQARLKLGKRELTAEQYDEFIKKEIQEVVKFQEDVGLDLLVHGEPERNDMVQYFGELLNGFVFTQQGWVQSYGSRYVRPPIIVSDVSRSSPMTVKWSSYAQSITKLPMKGMLTGPVTILNWSFPRIDVTREIQSKQLALALRDEVIDLEAADIKAIQVDEPAIREGLPLRRADWDAYLTWAVDSFRLATAGVQDKTQTHSHFCYSDFNDIFPSIQRLDADVISIEASKSDMKLLSAFQEFGYKNYIGPGVYDIHSPRVPSEQEIKDRIKDMLTLINPDYLFVNPDCGLKTRQWKETKGKFSLTIQDLGQLD